MTIAEGVSVVLIHGIGTGGVAVDLVSMIGGVVTGVGGEVGHVIGGGAGHVTGGGGADRGTGGDEEGGDYLSSDRTKFEVSQVEGWMISSFWGCLIEL